MTKGKRDASIVPVAAETGPRQWSVVAAEPAAPAPNAANRSTVWPAGVAVKSHVVWSPAPSATWLTHIRHPSATRVELRMRSRVTAVVL